MKYLAYISFGLTCLPFICAACEPDAEQMGEYFAREQAQEIAYVDRLARESDEIFVGSIVKIEDVDSGPYMQRAVIKVEKLLKGPHAREKRALMDRREEPTPHPNEKGAPIESIASCTDLPDPADPNPQAIMKTRALFYVRSGALVRISPFHFGPPPFTAAAETQHVQNDLHGAHRP